MGDYESHGNIAPFGDVMTCKDCGAVIRAVRRQHHDAWHDKINELMQPTVVVAAHPAGRGKSA